VKKNEAEKNTSPAQLLKKKWEKMENLHKYTFIYKHIFVQIWAKNESENKQEKIAFPQIFELSEK